MKKILITGGCGFIGSNAALFFKEEGWEVHILDNLSRSGAKLNLNWLNTKGDFFLHQMDIREEKEIDELISFFNKIKFKKYTFLLCTSSYPTPYDQVNLNKIKSLKI